MSVALRQTMRRIAIIRRAIATLEYGLLAVATVLVSVGVLAAIGNHDPDLSARHGAPVAIQTVRSHPAPQAFGASEPDPETVGGIADLGLRR